MRNYRHYPEYKDSGIEWLGEIPAHWEIDSLKRKATYISRGNTPRYVDESEIRVLNQACIYWDGIHLANVKYQATTDISQWKGVLRKGDLVINSTGTGTLGRATVFEEDGPFIADSHVTIVRLKGTQKIACYLRYLLETPVYQGYIQTALVTGSTNQIELSHEGLASMPVIAPPSTEMDTITLFLDRETAKIDALIEKKERLIKLLKEKRTALITHAVTKGLDPNVPMKDSRIEWLGKIPAHWEIASLKRKATYISRGNAPQYVDESEIRVLNQACIYWDGIHLANVKYQATTDISQWKGVLRKGDLVINSTGTGTLGRAAVFEDDGPFIADSHVTIVRLKETQKASRYLRYLLETPVYQGYVKTALVSGSTNQIELSHEGLASMPVIVPPSTEIDTITLFLDRETAKIDALIAKIEEAIKLLKEYRTALISAAVTGKIDVRNE